MIQMENYKTEEKNFRFEDIDLSGTYAYADYLRWEFEERLELIKGRIFKMGGPATLHQQISMNLGFKLHGFLRGKPCKVFAAPFDVRLPQQSLDEKAIHTVVQPDLCVICDSSKIDTKGCIGAPDIVVEILSPGNNRKELKNKFEVYEEAGVKEYWIIHSVEKTLFKYVLDEHGRFQSTHLLTLGDMVMTSILPGLELSLDEVFAD
jgi:Uma2 family endonuclease